MDPVPELPELPGLPNKPQATQTEKSIGKPLYLQKPQAP